MTWPSSRSIGGGSPASHSRFRCLQVLSIPVGIVALPVTIIGGLLSSQSAAWKLPLWASVASGVIWTIALLNFYLLERAFASERLARRARFRDLFQSEAHHEAERVARSLLSVQTYRDCVRRLAQPR